MTVQQDLPNENRETNEVITAIDRVSGGIDRVIKKLSPATIAQFTLTAAAQATHVKMRTQTIVMSPGNAAGIATLVIGTERWPFVWSTVGAMTFPIALPFVQIIDRGVDISLVLSGGMVTCTAYLIYTAE